MQTHYPCNGAPDDIARFSGKIEGANVDSYIASARQFIIDNFLFGEDNGLLTEDASFRDLSLIDSTGILELVDFLEESYGLNVDEDELTPENFDSLTKISQFVRRKLDK